MKIVFMGTPEFAARSLERLYEAGRDICAVFTQPDKPVNRGMKVLPTPVKQVAEARGTPVYQPEKLRDGSALALFEELRPDIIVVVAYGRLLPKEILELPPLGCINIHGSVLPKYRGAAPVQWAVLNGEKTTGVTAMHMAEEMDAGDIIDVLETEIGPDETSGELFARLRELGAELLLRTLDSIESGHAERQPQNDAAATFAPMLTRELSPVAWGKSAAEIHDHVRGMQPWPGATAVFDEKHFKIFKVTREPGQTDRAPGTVVSAGKDGLLVAAGGGEIVRVLELQAEGKKRMSAADYLRGNPISAD